VEAGELDAQIDAASAAVRERFEKWEKGGSPL
jgi:hypothetical protein